MTNLHITCILLFLHSSSNTIFSILNDPKFLDYYIWFSILHLNSQFSTKKKTSYYADDDEYVFFHVHVSVEFTNILLISEPDHYAQTGPVFNKS
jgi:hypothetical protein